MLQLGDYVAIPCDQGSDYWPLARVIGIASYREKGGDKRQYRLDLKRHDDSVLKGYEGEFKRVCQRDVFNYISHDMQDNPFHGPREVTLMGRDLSHGIYQTRYKAVANEKGYELHHGFYTSLGKDKLKECCSLHTHGGKAPDLHIRFYHEKFIDGRNWFMHRNHHVLQTRNHDRSWSVIRVVGPIFNMVSAKGLQMQFAKNQIDNAFQTFNGIQREVMCMHLYHGRKTPQEELNDWGSQGPAFLVESIQGTYGGTAFQLHGLDGVSFGDHVRADIELWREDGLILYNGVYYGDYALSPMTIRPQREYLDEVELFELWKMGNELIRN